MEKRLVINKNNEIQFDNLNKGDYISVKNLERYLNAKRGTEKFNFGVLALRETIERHFEMRGISVVIATNNYDLHILSDNDAVNYTERKFENHFVKMQKIHHKAMNIDQNNLDNLEKEVLGKNLTIMGAIVSAANDALRKTKRLLNIKSNLIGT